MKRLVTLLLAAGLLLGGASYSTANAVELTAGGQWQWQFGWFDNRLTKGDGEDNFYAAQRIRPQFNFVADENLKGTIQLEIGQGQWGNGAWGMGADSTSAIKFRHGFLDWVVPGVGTKVRMGLSNFQLPTYTKMASLIGFDDSASLILNQQISDELGVSLFWARMLNVNTTVVHDAVDAFGLTATYKGDGFKLTPKFVLAMIGENAFTGTTATASNFNHLRFGLLPVMVAPTVLPDGDTAWWLGLTGEVSVFDPFVIAWDFMYGSVDFGTAAGQDLKRAGWVLDATAMYKFDFANVGLAAWYGSGDDSNANDGSERLPSLYADTNGTARLLDDSGWGLSTVSATHGLFAGTWGLQLRAENMSFVKGLKHTARVAYVKGNNDKAMAAVRGAAGVNTVQNVYLTEEDSAWAMQFDTVYNVYKNFTVGLNLAYVKLDFDEGVWGNRGNFDDKLYECTLQMQYKF